MPGSAEKFLQPSGRNQEVRREAICFLLSDIVAVETFYEYISLAVQKNMGGFVKESEPQMVIRLISQAQNDHRTGMPHSPEGCATGSAARELSDEHDDHAAAPAELG